jgi:hypothetical protein
LADDVCGKVIDDHRPAELVRPVHELDKIVLLFPRTYRRGCQINPRSARFWGTAVTGFRPVVNPVFLLSAACCSARVMRATVATAFERAKLHSHILNTFQPDARNSLVIARSRFALRESFGSQ